MASNGKNPLGPDDKLSSASAAMSLKHARATDLPSFPSTGIANKQASAGAAASLAVANQKAFEHWKPGESAPANKAAVLAADYRMDPLWQPEDSSAGAKAARLAAQGFKSPEALKAKGGPSSTTTGAKGSPAQLDAATSKKAYLAATGATSGRQRSGSTPTQCPRYPDAANSASNALKAATSATRSRHETGAGSHSMDLPGLSPADVARIHGAAVTNMSREMYTSAPPVAPEVDEKNRQAGLHAAAVSMAKSMYTVAEKRRSENDAQALGSGPNASLHAATSVHHRRTSSMASSSAESGSPSRQNTAMQYLNLQEAAQKLAAERLAKLNDEGAEYRSYYGTPGAPPARSRLSMLGRRRASSDGQAGPGDEARSRQIRSEMSLFNKSLAEVDARKRQQDREQLLAAARRNVTRDMQGLDEKVYADTGKVAPSLRADWGAKAREKAEEDGRARMNTFGKVDIGAGKFMEKSEVEAIAAMRVQPTLDQITKKAEEDRARDERMRQAAEEARLAALVKEADNKERDQKTKEAWRNMKEEEKQEKELKRMEERMQTDHEKRAREEATQTNIEARKAEREAEKHSKDRTVHEWKTMKEEEKQEKELKKMEEKMQIDQEKRAREEAVQSRIQAHKAEKEAEKENKERIKHEWKLMKEQEKLDKKAKKEEDKTRKADEKRKSRISAPIGPVTAAVVVESKSENIGKRHDEEETRQVVEKLMAPEPAATSAEKETQTPAAPRQEEPREESAAAAPAADNRVAQRDNREHLPVTDLPVAAIAATNKPATASQPERHDVAKDNKEHGKMSSWIKSRFGSRGHRVSRPDAGAIKPLRSPEQGEAAAVKPTASMDAQTTTTSNEPTVASSGFAAPAASSLVHGADSGDVARTVTPTQDNPNTTTPVVLGGGSSEKVSPISPVDTEGTSARGNAAEALRPGPAITDPNSSERAVALAGVNGGASATPVVATDRRRSHSTSISSLSSDEPAVVASGSGNARGRAALERLEKPQSVLTTGASSVGEEFEEARDGFEEGALPPPPKGLGKGRMESPARETRFHEEL